MISKNRLSKLSLAMTLALTPAITTSHANAGIEEIIEEVKEHGKSPSEWWSAKWVEVTNAFTDKIKEEIAEGVFEDMWEELGKGIGKQLGQVIGDSLSSMFSFGPFLNFSSLLTINKPSEAQAMTQIILEALEEMEGRIIDSIDEQYVDEVKDDLNALKNNFADHNVRTDYKLRLTDGDVIEIAYMPAAMDILGAFEGSVASKVDNLHNYMLVNSLWIQMLAEDVQYDFLEAYSKPIHQMSQQEIVDILNDSSNRALMKEDYELRLQQRITAINDFVKDFTLEDWKAANKEMFSKPILGQHSRFPVVFDGHYPQNASPFVQVEWVKNLKSKYGDFILDCSSSFYWPHVIIREGQWSYKVEGETLSNKQYFVDCNEDYQAFVHTNYYLDNNGDAATNAQISLNNNISKNFPLMVISGYAPVQEMLDSWWKLANMGYGRPQNELDQFLHPYDLDEDGLTNEQEAQYGTNPNLEDSDGDGLTDHHEIFVSGTDPLVAENSSPSITITSPGNNGTFSAGSSITFKVNAEDNDGSVTKVEYYANGYIRFGTKTQAPFTYTVTSVPAGTFDISVVAYDDKGAKTESKPIRVNIKEDNTNIAPTIALTSPANNSVFAAGSTVNLVVNAKDSDGNISKVEYYANGYNLFATVTQPPFNFSAKNVPPGTYDVMARAYDNEGKETNSSTITLTFSN